MPYQPNRMMGPPQTGTIDSSIVPPGPARGTPIVPPSPGAPAPGGPSLANRPGAAMPMAGPAGAPTQQPVLLPSGASGTREQQMLIQASLGDQVVAQELMFVFKQAESMLTQQGGALGAPAGDPMMSAGANAEAALFGMG